MQVPCGTWHIPGPMARECTMLTMAFENADPAMVAALASASRPAISLGFLTTRSRFSLMALIAEKAKKSLMGFFSRP